MFDFLVTLTLDSSTLQKRVARKLDSHLFEEFFFLPLSEVSAFITHHALVAQDITLDAVATYLSILTPHEYTKIIALLAKGNITIGKK